MLLRTCIIAIVVFPMMLSSFCATAQGNLLLQNKMNIPRDGVIDVRRAVAFLEFYPDDWNLDNWLSAQPTDINTLVRMFESKNPIVRQAAALSLAKIGPVAVPALVKALESSNPDVRWASILALAKIGQVTNSVIPALIKMLRDPEPVIRWAATSALAEVGPAAEPAVSALVKTLSDPDSVIRWAAASALAKIATSLSGNDATGALDLLREARDAIESHSDPKVIEYGHLVRQAVKDLELRMRKITAKDIFTWSEKNIFATFIIIAYPFWIVLCFILLFLNPAAILKINDILRPFSFKLPDWLGGMAVSLRHLLLVGVLNYRPRVLDAWVSRHVAKARENFEYKPTVKERSVYVPVPVTIDEETISELKGRPLRAVFGTGTGRLLIWGEGGAGKTSIACQIARWAMADTPAQRPAPHRMLPVLIERELDFEVGEKKDPFTETVRGDLEKLIEDQVDGELLAALLKRRRILVIVDHLSEMSEATRKRVRPDVPNFPVAALIVTSRLEERLGDVPKDLLKPLRVTGDYLFEFMSAYLKAHGVRELFPDREFGGAGVRIAELVGERDVTVLLVKLYLDRLIATKETGGDVDKEMPGSIPSLMWRYLNDINRAVPEDVRRDERAVHRDAEALAWICLEERLRPAATRIDEDAAPALAAVNPEGVKERLDYLERRLRLIETVEPERTRLRFTLDPVAEYLAGLHAVKRYQANAEAWRGFLAQADAMSGGLEAIRGFLLAVHDCCLANERKVEVPEFVPDELAARAGLDLERLRQARLQERIARYTSQLKANDPDDRRLAAETLGRIGPAAEAAVPALVKVLGDADSNVQQAAVVTLGEIGPAAAPAVPVLVEALVDPNLVMRHAAAVALRQIGPTAEAAMPALVKALADPDPGVWQATIEALGEIGSAAAPAVPALIRALADPNLAMRHTAAMALRQIGPAAEAAVPALIKALADPNLVMRHAAAMALRQIGPVAVPVLVKALIDPDIQNLFIQHAAAEVLREIGPTAAPAVPALVEALVDPNLVIRHAAAIALRQIGPVAAPAVSALVSALADPNIQHVAAEALGRIGPAAAPAVPALVKALADPDVRQAVAMALGWIGPTAEAAVPALLEALADSDPSFRQRAAIALGQIGRAAGPAVPALVKALADPDVRQAAAEALREIRPAAEASSSG